MHIIRVQRARQAGFPIGLQDRCWDLVKDRLRVYDYTEPVGLSCDDTKLFAAFRPYYDLEREKYFILGCTGEPLEINDPDDFSRIVKEAHVQKATKVRDPRYNIPVISCLLSVSFDYGAFKYHYQDWRLSLWQPWLSPMTLMLKVSTRMAKSFWTVCCNVELKSLRMPVMAQLLIVPCSVSSSDQHQSLDAIQSNIQIPHVQTSRWTYHSWTMTCINPLR
jgi:hypothetical protein